ncbi:uncharacterized protein RAG0_08200 [Rhynchosporium agropyri]|uniref:Uncharacterized protein n=1 Tax=Rhynchosporium agropyri TaxID=914238 RepID=A0A1E1KPJ1_9HELO|nr:uncharacterized protein RAG0_08200 [Rhynchosporium agropyri]
MRHMSREVSRPVREEPQASRHEGKRSTTSLGSSNIHLEALKLVSPSYTREPSILDRLGFPEQKTSRSAPAEDTIRDTIKSNTIKEETGSESINNDFEEADKEPIPQPESLKPLKLTLTIDATTALLPILLLISPVSETKSTTLTLITRESTPLIKLSLLSIPIRFVTPASSLLTIRFTNFATTEYTITTRKYEINYNYTTLDKFLAINNHKFRNIATKQNLNKKATATTILVKVPGILKRETHFGTKRATKSGS